MSVYLISVNLKAEKRIYQINIFFLIFSSHINNYQNIIFSQHELIVLDKNLQMQINNESKFMCTYTLAFLENMFQQNINSKIKNFIAF